MITTSRDHRLLREPPQGVRTRSRARRAIVGVTLFVLANALLVVGLHTLWSQPTEAVRIPTVQPVVSVPTEMDAWPSATSEFLPHPRVVEVAPIATRQEPERERTRPQDRNQERTPPPQPSSSSTVPVAPTTTSPPTTSAPQPQTNPQPPDPAGGDVGGSDANEDPPDSGPGGVGPGGGVRSGVGAA